MKYLHVSRTYTPLYDPLHPGRLVGYQPSPGMTYNVGRNKAKRAERARVAASRGRAK